MADPLSLAASIAGLVSLSGAVFQQVSKFIKEVKGAEKQVRDLALQARNLSGVLQNLSLLASSLEDENSKTTFKAHHLFACSQTLFDIEIKLKNAQDDFDKGSKAKSLLRSFRWPFSTEETKSLASDLANHCNTLDLALSAETLERLLQCLASQDEIKSGIKSLTQAIERIYTIQTRVEMNKSRQEIVQFFLRVNPQFNYQTAMRLRQPLSGLWLTESDATFRKWRETPHSALWLSGIPGAGKTILCGVAIEDVLQLSSASTAVAFFFCDYKSPASQQLVNILCSIAVQLAQQNPTAFDILERYFKLLNPNNGLQQQPEVDALHDVISQLTSKYEQVFLVIDGLDECGNNVEQVAPAITKVFEDCPSVSLAVFSRNEFEIREELEAYCSHVEIAAHREDLELYVRAEMSKRRQLKRLEVQNPALSEEIRVKLIDGAQGMFRWMTCQLDYLCDLNTNRARREALQSLPPTLEETYHRILQRVIQAGPQASQLVQKTLHWTALGAELTLAQLQEGVSIPEEDLEETNDDFGEDDLIETDEIFRRCSSLVRKAQMVGAAGQPIDTLEFAHFTVEEYLVGIDSSSDVATFKFQHKKAIEQLSKTCMHSIFIAGGKFKQPFSTEHTRERLDHLMDTFRVHPFYFYSTAFLSGSLQDLRSPQTNMKSFITFALAALAASSPIPPASYEQPEIASSLEIRATGPTAKEFTTGGCRDVIFIFARGSTEVGNMGSTVGPPTSDGLKKCYGDNRVATEGVDYAAGLTTNFLPGGADPEGVTAMKKLLNDATSKCPNAKIVAGGYSQGAAVAHRSIESLSDTVKNRILGVITYGDTQNTQDKQQIPNFPKDKVKIICNDGDDVCKGTLEVEPAHLDYVKRVPEAVEFLIGKIGNI
ncbi:ankyrin repeat protein [Colletotrichum karsti]|uniref:Cutinase n=1 Tax=Colletotrichum karsti TaxID=1095194 RepID=A0A9P6I9G8_9PEZI|nr:ankyrin repeat protein [Colletotrichum karsti]KAF9878450.1 ankyrin repeat protein [Colletotrichum karsti]